MTAPAWYPTEKNKVLILDFILRFSRIEYALKSSANFSGKKHGHFQARWEKFSKELSAHPIPNTLSAAIEYIKKEPPMKQDGAHIWNRPVPKDSWELLVSALKTVRNNLFHGGKHHTGPVLEPIRDEQLLTHCLDIMRVMIELAPDEIKTTFHHTT